METDRKVCVRGGGSRSSPGLTLDLCKVTNTHGATHTCVQVPADLKVGMVRVWPGNKNNEKQT